MTVENKKEIIKCKESPIYFIENYVNLRGTETPFILPDYQVDIVMAYTEHRHNIASLRRQCGKSSVSCAIALHHAIFNCNSVVQFVAPNIQTSQSIMEDIEKMLNYIPNWIKHGRVNANNGVIDIDNGSKIVVGTEIRQGIHSDLLILDEFAFIGGDKVDIEKRLLPHLVGEQTRTLITSTPNGKNDVFNDIWDGKPPYANFHRYENSNIILSSDGDKV